MTKRQKTGRPTHGRDHAMARATAREALVIQTRRTMAALAAEGVTGLGTAATQRVLAAILGHRNVQETAELARRGALAVPVAIPLGTTNVAGHRMVAALDPVTRRPYAVEAAGVGAGRDATRYGLTAYGTLVDQGDLADSLTKSDIMEVHVARMLIRGSVASTRSGGSLDEVRTAIAADIMDAAGALIDVEDETDDAVIEAFQGLTEIEAEVEFITVPAIGATTPGAGCGALAATAIVDGVTFGLLEVDGRVATTTSATDGRLVRAEIASDIMGLWPDLAGEGHDEADEADQERIIAALRADARKRGTVTFVTVARGSDDPKIASETVAPKACVEPPRHDGDRAPWLAVAMRAHLGDAPTEDVATRSLVTHMRDRGDLVGAYVAAMLGGGDDRDDWVRALRDRGVGPCTGWRQALKMLNGIAMAITDIADEIASSKDAGRPSEVRGERKAASAWEVAIAREWMDGAHLKVVQRGGYTPDALIKCGDPAFELMMLDVSIEEDCGDVAEATRRLRSMAKAFSDIAQALSREVPTTLAS